MESSKNSAPEVVELEATPVEPPPLPTKPKTTETEAPVPLSVQGGLPPRQWPPRWWGI